MSQDNTPKTIPEGILELLESSIASMMKESKRELILNLRWDLQIKLIYSLKETDFIR